MNKKRLLTLSLLFTMLLQMVAPLTAEAYTIDTTYNKMRSYQFTNNKYIVLHETGTYAPAVNNAIYFDREWANVGAYTSFVVGDGGKVYQVSPDGYVQWGAGSYEGNYNSPVQIEFARTTNKEQFKLDYKAYIDLVRDMANKYNIPLTLDTAPGNSGVKTHYWFTQNYGGDHVDPYGYLQSMGISKAQLARDIANGVNGQSGGNTGGGQVSPEKPNTSSPSYESKIGTYKFSVQTKIRNGLGLSGQYSGYDYHVGQTVNYDRIYHNVDGYDWLSYISYGGSRRYVAMINGSGPVTPNTSYESKSGTYTFNYTTRIRNGVGVNGQYSGYDYKPGQTVNYDRIYRNVDGYDWLSYISYNGVRRYVAMIGGSQPVNPSTSYESVYGTFTFNYMTRIRNGVGLNGEFSGYFYMPGSSVNYDRIYRNVDGYDWLSYISYNGVRRFVAII